MWENIELHICAVLKMEDQKMSVEEKNFLIRLFVVYTSPILQQKDFFVSDTVAVLVQKLGMSDAILKRAREALELYFAMPDSGDFTETVFNLVKEIEGPNSAVENYFRMNRSSRMDFVCLDVLTPVQLIQHSATLVQRIPEALKIKLKPYLDQLGPKQAIGLTNSLPPELKKEFVKAQLQQQITTPKKEEYRALLMTLDPSTEYEVELLNLFKSVKEKLGLKEAIALLANSAMAALNKDSLSDVLFNRFNPDTEDLFWEMIKLAAANCPAKIPSLFVNVSVKTCGPLTDFLTPSEISSDESNGALPLIVNLSFLFKEYYFRFYRARKRN